MVIAHDVYDYFSDQLYDAIGGKENAPRQYMEDIDALIVYLRIEKKLDGMTVHQIDDKTSEGLNTLKESLKGRNKGDPNIPPELRKRMTEGTATISLQLGKYREPLMNLDTNLANEWKDLLDELGSLLNDFYEQGIIYLDKTERVSPHKASLLSKQGQYRDLNFGRLIDKMSITISRLKRLEKDTDSWAAIVEGNNELTDHRVVKKLSKKALNMATQLTGVKNNLEQIQSEIDRFVQVKGFTDDKSVEKWFKRKKTTLRGETLCFTIYYKNCIELLKASKKAQNLVKEVKRTDDEGMVANPIAPHLVKELRVSIHNKFRGFSKFKDNIQPSTKSGEEKEIEEITKLLHEAEKIW